MSRDWRQPARRTCDNPGERKNASGAGVCYHQRLYDEAVSACNSHLQQEGPVYHTAYAARSKRDALSSPADLKAENSRTHIPISLLRPLQEPLLGVGRHRDTLIMEQPAWLQIASTYALLPDRASSREMIRGRMAVRHPPLCTIRTCGSFQASLLHCLVGLDVSGFTASPGSSALEQCNHLRPGLKRSI